MCCLCYSFFLSSGLSLVLFTIRPGAVSLTSIYYRAPFIMLVLPAGFDPCRINSHPVIPISKGKCKSCGHRISFMYPAAELVTACLFAAAGIRFGMSLELLTAVVFLSSHYCCSDRSSLYADSKSNIDFFLPFWSLRD